MKQATTVMKTPDQELLIARADAMLAQAEARSATLQDDLRNLGRTPGSATPDTPDVPVPGADPAETFPPNLRTPSLKYPTKGR